MSDDIGFRVVCTKCACLSIKIEEPLTATREAIVYCSDCGTSRGTVGALRDLAVQRHSDVVFPTISSMPPLDASTTANTQPANEIPKRYAELRRLRRQVEIAEWLASEASNRSSGHGPARTRKTRHPASRPSMAS
jgi:hypothetical protein